MPTGCADGVSSRKGQPTVEGDGYREMANLLIAGSNLEEKPHRRHTSNEISAPYEVPQYPIEQIETKLNRYFINTHIHNSKLAFLI